MQESNRDGFDTFLHQARRNRPKSRLVQRHANGSVGADALRYMRREEHHAAAIRPDLVLLDLNLPGMDGRQVLAEVRSDVRLNGIPVVIFTSSPADDDVLLAFNFHAEGYLRKPVRLEEFNQLLDRLEIGM